MISAAQRWLHSCVSCFVSATSRSKCGRNNGTKASSKFRNKPWCEDVSVLQTRAAECACFEYDMAKTEDQFYLEKSEVIVVELVLPFVFFKCQETDKFVHELLL